MYGGFEQFFVQKIPIFAVRQLICYNMKDRGMQLFDMSMMPANDTTIRLEDKLMVMDNLSNRLIEESDEVNRFMSRFPVKLSSTCMVIVIKGRVKFNVNFRDFVSDGNTCVIISSGTIVEKVEADDQARLIFLSFSPKNLPSMTDIKQHKVQRLYALQVVLLHLLPSHLELLKLLMMKQEVRDERNYL